MLTSHKDIDHRKVLDLIHSLHQAIGHALVGHLIHLLLGLQELLLKDVRNLADEDLLAVVFVIVKHFLGWQELVVTDERLQFHLELLRVQE